MIRLLFLIISFFSITAQAESFSKANTLKQSTANILVLGDSISAEFGLRQNQGWVYLLQQRLITKEYPHKVINASISGETSSGGLRHIASALDLHQPVCVIIELGANDGLRGLNLTQLKNNLTRIARLSLEHKAKVLIIGMQLPPNYGLKYTQTFSQVFKEVSNNLQLSIVPFMFKGFESNLTYFQADRIHPNDKAQSLILDNIWPELLPLLNDQ